MTDFAKEALFERIDEQWEDFGLPKVELDNIDSDSTDFPTKGSKKVQNRATRRKATAKKKARNKRLAKAKGFNLNLCSRPDKNGSHSPLSNVYSSKKFYDTIKGAEQSKVSARELKKYFDSPVEKQTDEEYFKDFLDETYDKSLEELVDEYLKLRYEVMIKNDPYRHFKRNDFLNIMSVDTEHDAMERFYRYGEWLDYDTLYVTLSNLVHKMKQRKRTFAPVFEIAESISDNFYIHVRVTTEMFPDNFDISDLAHCSGLFIEREAIQARHVVAYRFHVLTEAKEQFPLFTIDRSTYTARELDYISKELNDRFETLSNDLWWEENWWEESHK